MPLYEFQCAAHDVFALFRPISAAGQAGECPECGRLSPRLLSVPNVRVLGNTSRAAAQRNEKSRHEPAVCSGIPHRHATQKSAAGADTTSPKPKLVSCNGPRPWVVEHR